MPMSEAEIARREVGHELRGYDPEEGALLAHVRELRAALAGLGEGVPWLTKHGLEGEIAAAKIADAWPALLARVRQGDAAVRVAEAARKEKATSEAWGRCWPVPGAPAPRIWVQDAYRDMREAREGLCAALDAYEAVCGRTPE